MGYYTDKKKKFDETFSQMKMKILNFQTLLNDFDANLEIVSYFLVLKKRFNNLFF